MDEIIKKHPHKVPVSSHENMSLVYNIFMLCRKFSILYVHVQSTWCVFNGVSPKDRYRIATRQFLISWKGRTEALSH